MKQPIKLRFKKWWYYLRPGYWHWLKQCNKVINEPQNLDAIDTEARKRLCNLMVCGATHPELEPGQERFTKLWQEAAGQIVKS